MMQTAQDRTSHDFTIAGCVVVQRAVGDALSNPLMGSATVEVVMNILSQDAAKVIVSKDQKVIETLAPKAANEPLTNGIHIRMKAAEDLDISAACDGVELPKLIAEFAIPVAN